MSSSKMSPTSNPSFQPRGGTLVQLPAIFASGQPQLWGGGSFRW